MITAEPSMNHCGECTPKLFGHVVLELSDVYSKLPWSFPSSCVVFHRDLHFSIWFLQIMQFTHHQVSFVQVRGSVPVFWSQTGIKYKPPPKIEKGKCPFCSPYLVPEVTN